MTPAERYHILLMAILDHAASYGYGDVDPLLILAQSALESANFTSRRIEEDFNAFGMRMPAQRPTTAMPGPGGFARYHSLEDSVVDYFMRQRYFDVDGSSVSAYVASTMDPAHPYAQEGQSYVDAWLRKYAGSDPDDVAWTNILDEFEVVGTAPGGQSAVLLFLALGLAATMK